MQNKTAEKMKSLQYGVLVFGNPSKKEPRRTGLHFVERTRRGAVPVVLWLYVGISKISQKVTKKQKQKIQISIAWENKERKK